MKQNDLLYLKLKDKMSPKNLILLKEKLEQLEQNGKDLTFLFTYPLKKPSLGLIFSLLFGFLAVDRFYKGDILLACIKLALLIVPFFTFLYFLLEALYEAALSHGNMFLFFYSLLVTNGNITDLCLLSLIASGVWKFADIYFVFVGIKKDNFNKIMKSLF